MAGCVCFAGASLAQFVTAVAADPQIAASREALDAVALKFPGDARVQARLAARLVEAGGDQAQSHEGVAKDAMAYAERAVKLAPRSYEPRLLLAAAAEMNSNLVEAEAALRAALLLAPYHLTARWRLANLLVRTGKLGESLREFQIVTAADPKRLPATLELVWQASEGDLEAVSTVAGQEPKAKLQLAQFLVKQSQPDAAAKLFRSLDQATLLELTESGQVIDALLAAGNPDLASSLWLNVHGDQGGQLLLTSILANGSFETSARKHLAQFDWQLSSSDYARVGLTREVARGGQRSLRIAYLGLETTRLEGQIRQLIVVDPGARYRLTAYVKSDKLVTPEGPQLAVMRTDAKTPLAVSAAVAAGSHDWHQLILDFVAPREARTLLVTIRQTPQFSFVEPTRGTVWFDDFTLTAEGEEERSRNKRK